MVFCFTDRHRSKEHDPQISQMDTDFGKETNPQMDTHFEETGEEMSQEKHPQISQMDTDSKD